MSTYRLHWHSGNVEEYATIEELELRFSRIPSYALPYVTRIERSAR
jgi:hypothetical protein